MFTDDISITFASNNVEQINETINSDLEEIRLWLAANKRTLNMTKTEFLLLVPDRDCLITESPTIRITKIPVEQVSTTKSLSVHIDQNLNWDFHVKEISKKIASGISATKRISNFVPLEILFTKCAIF